MTISSIGGIISKSMIWAISSVGQSSRLITGRSGVRVPDGPPNHRGIAQLVEQRSPKPRAEGSSPSAPAIKRYQKRYNAEKARFIGLFLLPLSRILFYKIIDIFITFSKTVRTRTFCFKVQSLIINLIIIFLSLKLYIENCTS